MLLDQLLRPFGYLAIRHPYKWIVDWLYPAILMLFTMILLYLSGTISATTKAGGVLSLVLSFVQSLPGFYCGSGCNCYIWQGRY